MNEYLLTCSIDAINVDYEQIIVADSEPDFWTCYDIAREHDCEWWMVDMLEDEK